MKQSPRVSFATTNGLVYVATNLPSFIISTNLHTPGRLFDNVPMRNTGVPMAPAPGVYKTEPYTCIVVVPGGHPDDKMMHPRGTQPSMPTVQPDLRFIPLKHAELAAETAKPPESPPSK